MAGFAAWGYPGLSRHQGEWRQLKQYFFYLQVVRSLRR